MLANQENRKMLNDHMAEISRVNSLCDTNIEDNNRRVSDLEEKLRRESEDLDAKVQSFKAERQKFLKEKELDQTEILNKKDQEMEILKIKTAQDLERIAEEFGEKISDLESENCMKLAEFDIQKNSELERLAEGLAAQKSVEIQDLEAKLRQEFTLQAQQQNLNVSMLEDQLVTVTTEKLREVLELTQNFNSKMEELKSSDKSEVLNEKLHQEMLRNQALE